MNYTYVDFEENRTYEDAVNIFNQRIEDAKWIYDKYKEKFIVRSCPCCGNNENKLQQSYFHDMYNVVKCGVCGAYFVDPCPPQEALNDYYANAKCNRMLENIYNKRTKKKRNVLSDDKVELLIDLICEYPKDSITFLELGCNNGGFLSRLRKRIEEVGIKKRVRLIGVDISEEAVLNKCDDNIELICDTAENYVLNYDGFFDFVYHSELLEHIIDPIGLTSILSSKMYGGGVMVFTTPNEYSFEMRGLDYNAMRVLACNIFPPMHLNSYGTHNITHFLIKHGFGVDRILTPGKLDVGILEMQCNDTECILVKDLAGFDENTKGYIQELLKFVGASSNMLVITHKLK